MRDIMALDAYFEQEEGWQDLKEEESNEVREGNDIQLQSYQVSSMWEIVEVYGGEKRP